MVDSGAEVSLLHRRVYNALAKKPPVVRKPARLQSVNGGHLKIDGCVTVTFKIGNTETKILHFAFNKPKLYSW